MSHFIRRVLYLSMGVLAGVAAWPAMETVLVLQASFGTYLIFSLVSGSVFGLIIGAFVGAVDGMIAASPTRIIGGAVFGALLAAIGGALGFVLGQGVLLLIGSTDAIHVTVARTIGWAILGVSVSIAEGARRRSLRRLFVGVVGGLVGGTVGGIAIETIPYLLPSYARPVGLVLYGLAVTGAYGIAERKITAGVLRLLNGRYKGKEFILNQRTLEVGSRRNSDIYLPEYRRITERHAQLKEVGGELIIYPLDEAAEVAVNDTKIDSSGSGILKFGDVLKVGSAKLIFRPLALLLSIVLATVGTGTVYAQKSAPPTDPESNGGSIASIRVAEVDTGRLLLDQTVDLYLGITDQEGNTIFGITPNDLIVEEAAGGGGFERVEILSLTEGAAAEEGITFFLLIDNSGSMYDRIDGRPTDTPALTRMATVRAAVRTLLDQVDNPKDQIALATFNTRYTLRTGATNSVRTIDLLLDEIARPEAEDAYTELYHGIASAARDLSETDGRRVLLVLSDGENYPFAEHAGAPHPDFGTQRFTRDDAIEEIRRYGIGVFGIDFTGSGDPELKTIAADGGGTVYNAASGTELREVYQDIRDRILEEYRLRYRASILPAEYRRVRVTAIDRGTAAVRPYFAGTLFGLPREDFGVLFLLPLAFALLAAFLLGQLRFRNDRTTANVEIFDALGRATQVLDLGGEKTVIGGAADADITIAGAPDLKDNHATIVHDPKSDTYSVVATEAITVNNRRTTRRKLEPGDVIELPGATVVFDLPEKE